MPKDILHDLNFANVDYQIIILMASSGMGRSKIISLTFEDFIKSLKEYYQPKNKNRFKFVKTKCGKREWK